MALRRSIGLAVGGHRGPNQHVDEQMTMFSIKMTGLAAVAVLAFGCAGFAAQAATVKISLWDKGPDSATPDDAHPMGLGSKGDMKMAMMGVKSDVKVVKAGSVTFEVTNASKDIVHEMILSPAPADGKILPYLADQYKVDEDAAGHLGEVSELDPGKSGSLTVDLKPGKYVLFCNIPAHFMGGMWTEITVE